MAEADCARVVV